jgi:integrase
MHHAFERFKVEALPKLKPATQRGYLYMLPGLARAYAHMRPRELKPSDGYALLARLHVKSPTQALKYFNLLSVVLTYCVRWGAIDENPFWQVRKGDYIPKARSRCPSDEEFTAVRGLATERMQIAMDLALLTGLRRSGIILLELAGVTADGLLSQRPGKRTKPLLFEVEKGGELEAVLERAKKLEPRVRGALLCTGKGKFYSADGFEANWQRLMKKAIARKAIAERFTFNDIRAKSATDTGDDVAASARLGHSSVELTKRVYIRKPAKVQPLKRISQKSPNFPEGAADA